MADIKFDLLDSACCEGEEGEGERGKRGKRGKRGHRGEQGPAGPAGSGGLLKFSGTAAAATEGILPVVSYLEDFGIGLGLGAGIITTEPSYPVAIARELQNLATNLLTFVVPPGGSILIELLKNGVAVPGFAISYGAGETGIKTLTAGPVAYAIGDTFDLRVTTAALFAIGVDVSATVGID